jgi:hypothetical protein
MGRMVAWGLDLTWGLDPAWGLDLVWGLDLAWVLDHACCIHLLTLVRLELGMSFTNTMTGFWATSPSSPIA